MGNIFQRALLSILLAGLSFLVMSLGRFTRIQIIVFAASVCILSFFSTRVRCSLFLMVPSIITKTGRVILAIYALQLVLEGPLTDFLMNLDILLRICICFTKLYLKYTIDSYRLSFDPAFKLFTELVNQNRHDQFNYTESDMAWVFDSVDSKPISEEFKVNFNSLKLKDEELKTLQLSESEHRSWTANLERKVKQGIEGDLRSRCEILLFLAQVRCSQKVRNTDLCSLLTFIPGWIHSIMCSRLVKGDSDEFTRRVCGEGRDIHLQTCSSLTFPEWFAQDISVNASGGNQNSSAVEKVFRTALAHIETYKSRTALMVRFLEITILLITPISFVVVYGFLYKYQHHPSFHNVYIYKDFPKFSEESGLTLDSGDLKRVTTFWTPTPLTNEWQGVERMLFSKVWLTVVLGICVMSISHLMANLLILINRESRVSGAYISEHNLSVHVLGIGVLAKFMRIILGHFVSSRRGISNVNTAVCLFPHRDSGKTFVILVVYAFMIISCMIELYAFRFRFVVCSFFYPEAHQRRMLHLCHSVMLWRSQRAAIAAESKQRPASSDGENPEEARLSVREEEEEAEIECLTLE